MGLQSRASYHKRNWQTPLRVLASKFVMVTLAKRYESAIRSLMLTPLSSLYYAPDYGTIFYRMRTQGVSVDKISMAMAQMRRAVSLYIPDVQIVDVTVELQDDQQTLRLVCTWLIRDATANEHGDLANQRQTTVLI